EHFLLLDVAREDAGESAQRRIAALQLLARLTAGVVVGIGRKPLRRVREEVLVRLLGGVDACVELCRQILGRTHTRPAGLACDGPLPTGQRLGSWCSRYC